MINVLDTFSLAGRTVLITGGGGGPLGRQMTQALAEAGARVIMTSRNVESLKVFSKSLNDLGYGVHTETLDQSDLASIQALRDRVISEHTRIDVLVNNAVLRPMGDWDSGGESFARSMSINATGLFAITQAFAGHMADCGGGSIINIGSIQGMVGPDFSLYEDLGWKIAPDYFFHKGGMLNFSRYVASKFGPYGVRSNVLSPGGCFSDQDPRFVERYNRRTMLGRMANETDLKGAVVFLASNASAYITGSNIVVDGGYTTH